MVTNQKPTGRAVSMPAGLAMGVSVSLVITIAGIWLLACLVSGERLLWENIGYGIMLVLLAASVSGAAIASAKIKRQRLLVCNLSGVLYLLTLLGITALFFGGQYEAVGVTSLLIMGGSAAVCTLGAGKRSQGRGKRRRIRS